MVSEARWRNAQQYEKGYWESVATEAANDVGRVGGYRWRAQELVRMLCDAGLNTLVAGSSRTLEIGSGPVGIAGFFPGSSKISVDPLEEFYRSKDELVVLRSPDVDYRSGTGESLPVGDGSVDLVAIENCIDHCRDMDLVMQEIARVLEESGVLYLTVNVRSRPGYFLHRLLSRLSVDAGHPHTFTMARLRTFLRRNGFEPVLVESGSFWEAWREDLAGPGLQARAKALLGVSEYVVKVIARRGS